MFVTESGITGASVRLEHVPKHPVMLVTPSGISGAVVRLVQFWKQDSIFVTPDGIAGATTRFRQSLNPLFMLVMPSGSVVADRSTYFVLFACSAVAISVQLLVVSPVIAGSTFGSSALPAGRLAR